MTTDKLREASRLQSQIQALRHQVEEFSKTFRPNTTDPLDDSCFSQYVTAETQARMAELARLDVEKQLIEAERQFEAL